MEIQNSPKTRFPVSSSQLALRGVGAFFDSRGSHAAPEGQLNSRTPALTLLVEETCKCAASIRSQNAELTLLELSIGVAKSAQNITLAFGQSALATLLPHRVDNLAGHPVVSAERPQLIRFNLKVLNPCGLELWYGRVVGGVGVLRASRHSVQGRFGEALSARVIDCMHSPSVFFFCCNAGREVALNASDFPAPSEALTEAR